MYKLTLAIMLIFSLIGHVKASTIPLKCSIIVTDFTGIEDQTQFFDAKLTGLKHKPTGSKKLTTINNYEFWVMNHSLQTIANNTHVVNFQVAIKDITNNTFSHALSNYFKPDLIKHSARISLVEYHKTELFEKGEVMFSCIRDMFDNDQ
jgi:hypothetical protein